MTEGPALGRPGALARDWETAFTLALVPFSLFYIWQATQVPEPPRNIVIGPRTFPLLVGGLMLVVSVLLAWRRLSMARRAPADLPQPALVVPLEDDEAAIADWPAVWTVLGSLLALFLVLEPLGFVASFTLFIFSLSTLFAPRRWPLNLLVSLGFSVFFYGLFTEVLGIPLPNGILESLL